jgi:cytochrome c oxidase subunit I
MSTTVTAAPPPPSAPPKSYSGIWGWMTTVDHKRIGIMYAVAAFFFFLVGGLEAVLVRVQLIVPNNDFISADFYNQLFTMHAITMVFLALMPLTAAYFNYVVPLQIGARDVAFPRLNALSLWIFIFGGIFINVSFLLNAAPNVGWTAYANLTMPEYSPGLNVDFYVLGLQVVGLSSLIASVNFIVTILNMRAPGMRLMRMPMFTWMTLITQVLIATAMAILTVALTQLMFDRFFGTNFYQVAAGADVVLWQHLFWMFGHPEVYILILPIFGMVSDILPTFSRKPLFGYNVIVFSGILIGWLGWGVWSHHMFTVGLGPIADSFFALSTMLIAIPTGIKIFNWLATIWGGALRFTTAMTFALGFLVTFTIGGISGVMHAVAPADLQQHDTYFVVAHIHYVFFGGTVMGLFAGMYYWYPKMTGRMLHEGLGQVHFWLTFVGMNLTFFPMHFLGLHGMPRRTFTYADGLGFDMMNFIATVGSFIIGIGALIFTYNLVVSWRKGRVAGPNPWGAATLEWAMSSPPPEYNFREIPVVHSRLPLWEKDPSKEAAVPHTREEEETEEVTFAGKKVTTMEDPHFLESKMSAHELGIHMPPPSYWPMVMAALLTLFFAGFMIHWTVPVVMGLGLMVSTFMLAFEPGHEPHH